MNRNFTCIATALLISLFFSLTTVGQIITTVAGPDNTGDNGLAVLATINDPEGTAVDAFGNTYITEGVAHRIRRISSTGFITTIAGTGVSGFSGDSGPASAAQIAYPTSIVVDALGNVFFSDWQNNRIRKISTNGTITTVAGNGTYGFSGDGGLATAASLNGPYGIGIDGVGTLYIADWNNHRIRKVGTNGIITTIAGNSAGFSGDGGLATAAQLNSPTGVAIDGSGNIYIGDYQNWRIRRIGSNGIITTIAGTGTQGTAGDNGPATSAQISFFAGPTVDANGNVYVPDFFNSRILKISTTGTITRFAGLTSGAGAQGDNGLATAAALSNPLGLAVDALGNVTIADRYNQRIRRINASGIITTIAGPNNAGFGGDDNLATFARLNYPADVKSDRNGNFYIAELGNSRIRKVDANGIITTFAGKSGSGFSGDGGLATNALISGVYGVLPDANGNVYIADTYNNRIRKVNAEGIITTIAGNGIAGFSGDGGSALNAQLKTPYNIAIDKSGNLYIADSDNNRIRRIGTDGNITTVAGTGNAGFGGDGGQAKAAQINFPTGISFDAADNLYIADNRNQRIRKVTPAGIITTVAGTGVPGYSGSNGPATSAQLSYPFGIVASASGTVFFCDNGNARVRRIGTDGVISDVAGTASRGFLGDGGPANQSMLDTPLGLGQDGSGNLLIADAGNARIRKVACLDAPVVSIVASATKVCVNDEISLIANVQNSNLINMTYLWTGNIASANSNTVSVVAAKGLNAYSVTVSTVTGCSSSASINFQAVELHSIKSGNWEDPSIWSCGRVPNADDSVTISIGHEVIVAGIAVAKKVILLGKLNNAQQGQLYLGAEKIDKITISEYKEIVSQVIPASGGDIIINDTKSLLNGLKIQVPNKAYTENKTFKVSYAPIIRHDMGADFNPVTPLIYIENGGGHADSMMTVTIPIKLPKDHYAVAMMYSKARGFELLPTVSLSDNEITVLTNHFDYNVLSGQIPNPQRSSIAGEYTDDVGIGIIVSTILGDKLENVSLTCDFQPGIDDWEFTNYGSFPEKARKGICSGMSVTALWYFENIKNKADASSVFIGPLFANDSFQKKYINATNNINGEGYADKVWMDNTLGIRFATMAQLAIIPEIDLLSDLKQFRVNSKLVNDKAIKNALTMYFRYENRPLYLAIMSRNKENRHAVIVYGISDQGIMISDPNKPGKIAVVTYSAEGLLYKTSGKADLPEEDYIYFTCIPPSLIVTHDILKDLWSKVDIKKPTIGDSKFPPFKFLINNNPNLEIGSNDVLSIPFSVPEGGSFSISTGECNDCVISLINNSGNKIVEDDNGIFILPPGKSEVGFYVRREILNEDGSYGTRWYDFKWITISVEVTPVLTTMVAINITFSSAQVQGIIQNYNADKVIGYGICYSIAKSQPTIEDSKVELVPENYESDYKSFFANLVNLTSGTNYYARSYYRTKTGVVYGNIISFITHYGPIVSTYQVSNITPSSAEIFGYIQNYNTDNILRYGMCYSEKTLIPTVSDSMIDFNVDPVQAENKSFSAVLVNLISDTRYYARAFVITSSGVIYGSVLSFDTAFDMSDPSLLYEYFLTFKIDGTKYDVYDVTQYGLTGIPNVNSGSSKFAPYGPEYGSNQRLYWYGLSASWYPLPNSNSFNRYLSIDIFDPPFSGAKKYILNNHLVAEYFSSIDLYYQAIAQKHPYISADLNIDGVHYLGLEGGEFNITHYVESEKIKGTFNFKAAEYVNEKFTGKIVNVSGKFRIQYPW